MNRQQAPKTKNIREDIGVSPRMKNHLSMLVWRQAKTTFY